MTTPGAPHRARVVVVDDEPAIADAVAARLRADGHEVAVAVDGPSAVALCQRVRPDLVVLDLMLPGVDGYEVCRRVQAERDVAVLVLTARDDEADVVLGLRLGADDYLTKPFSIRELSARVAALLRRASRPPSPDGADPPAAASLRLGEVELDLEARLTRRGGAVVHLTPTEFDLAVRLARRPGAVVGREQLLADVWGWRDAGGDARAVTTTRTVDSHVAALRRKLGDGVVRTVHGLGYAGALP